MPKRRSLADEQFGLRERDAEKRDDIATYKLGVDRVLCAYCDRMTTNPESVCDDHAFAPGGRYWGKALTVEQVREEMRRVRWDVA